MSLDIRENGVMGSDTQNVVYEFCHLLEKSKQLFNGLRELPQYGHKQWQSYFGRAFDIYTKLWKFQQQHRQLLDGGYGLKRWQIGEIASKIGQLYYHYYLRTSETNYLNESFAFYSAIRMRAYYSKANKEERPDLMVKKLRYYARFVIVCLLLKKMTLVRELIRELARQIDDYTAIYQPADAAEWAQVLQEIRAFIAADSPVTVLDRDSVPVVLTHRLGYQQAVAYPQQQQQQQQLRLAEILVVGNCSEQSKFSELTLDMFRMLQTLEREPSQLDATAAAAAAEEAAGGVGGVGGFDSPVGVAGAHSRRLLKQHSNGSEYHHQYQQQQQQQLQQVYRQQQHPGSGGGGGGSASSSAASGRRDNSHKYLLYKPSLAQLTAFLASGFKELPPDGVLMLYLSGDGERGTPSKLGDDYGFVDGGVVTNSRREQQQQQLVPGSDNQQNRSFRRSQSGAGLYKNPHCIYPGDIFPYTRKPMFLIVDSDNSCAFKNFPNMFGQPFVCLMSPEQVPNTVADQRQKGSLFTLFLHSPMSAFCLICNAQTLPLTLWDRGQAIVDRFLTEAGRMLLRSRQIDSSYLQFYRDDFMRLLMLRYLFCSSALRLHRGFRGPRFYPSAHPPLPEQLLFDGGSLQRLVLDLASLLDARSMFSGHTEDISV